MSSATDLLQRNTILEVATPFTDAAVRSFDTDAQARKQLAAKQQTELSNALQSKQDLLLSPDKIDNLVASNLEDIYPLTSKPKPLGLDRTAGIDESLKQSDHPMSGVGRTIRDNFKAALQDKSMALASPVEILNAVKQSALQSKGEDGKSLLEKSYEYKMDKDSGGLMSFHPSKFIPGMTPYEDKNTVALPGYAEYKEKNEKHGTSIPESIAMGAAGALIGVGITALTGGAAVPMAAIASKMAMAGAMAVPEFAAFDAAANAVKHSDWAQDESRSGAGKMAAEMALGLVAAVGTMKGLKGGASFGLTKAIEAGKVSEQMVGQLKKTGLAADAIKTFEARIGQEKALASVQDNLASANAALLKKATTTKLAQEVMVAAGRDESKLSTSEFINRLHGDDASELVKPLYAEAMGVDAEVLAQAKQNPAVLFSKIDNPEIEELVMQDIAAGMTAQEATVKGFQQAASIKLMESGRGLELEGMLKADGSYVYEGAERLGMPLGGKAPKGSVVKGSTTIDNSAREMDELLAGTKAAEAEALAAKQSARLGLPEGGKAPQGVGVKSASGVTELDNASNIVDNTLLEGAALDVEAERLLQEARLGLPLGGKADKGVSVMSGTTDITNQAPLSVEASKLTDEARLGVPEGGKAAVGAVVKGTSSIDNSLVNTVKSNVAVKEIKVVKEVPVVIGHDGSSITVKDLGSVLTNTTDATKPLVDGASLATKTLAGVMAAVASVPLLSLLSPSEAEASAGPLAGKLVSEVVAKSLMERVGGDLKKVFQVFSEMDLVSSRVAPGTTSLPARMQKQFFQAPSVGMSVEGARQVIGKTKSPFDGLARFMSTNFFSQVYGTTEKSVAVQLASMQNAMTNNINNGTDVAGYIIKNVKGIKPEHTTEIAEFMKPVQASFDDVAIPLRAAELETINAQKVIKNIESALKDGKYSAADAEMLIKEQKDKVAKLQELWHEYNPRFAAAETEYNAAKDTLMQKYPSARISFAVEDPSLLTNSKYKDLFTVDEKAAVAQFQEFYTHYKLRANEVGMETISGPYINHSRDNTAVNAAMQAKLDEYGVSVSKSIPMTEFFSRSKYSKQMIPDISRNAFDYVPDTERRIQGADFWRIGKQDGWDAFSKNEFVRSNKVWNDYFGRIKEGMIPPPQTTLNQWSNRYASIETLRLLAFLPSAPFKHLFKNEGTWASLGFAHSMKMIPEAVTVSARNTVNDVLRTRGLTEKMLPKGALDDFTQSMIKQRSMINPLSDLEQYQGVAQGVDKWLDKLNTTGGIGIRAVEAFDRTHTVQAALDMALKKGMTAEQAMFGIYDTILKNNFLGGSLNPLWMHNPKIRAIALFQNTPFKIMERRLSNAYKTGGDVKTAWGIIKNQNVEKTLGELLDLGAFIKSGQNEFKKNMIYDALTATKDSMGNSISQQFMKEFLITGAILGAGSATGVDFHSHSFHLPFVKSGGEGEPSLNTSPIVDSTWKTLSGAPSPGFTKENDDDKEFFTARFYRHWTRSTGGAQPLVLQKFRRISNDDIPEIYKDSKFKYLFSIPSSVEH